MRRNKPKKTQTIRVPCNGCTLCCQGDAVRLEPEDDPERYLTEPHPYLSGALMIAHKANGECVYLQDNGCSVHDRAPSLCRAADCRSIALKFDFDAARQLHLLGRLDLRVWNRGRQMIETMKRRATVKGC